MWPAIISSAAASEAVVGWYCFFCPPQDRSIGKYFFELSVHENGFSWILINETRSPLNTGRKPDYGSHR
jgi:hypothetical protein